MNSSTPRLLALLVAIDQYRSPVPTLSGCVNDLEKMSAYLQNESDHFEVNIQKLVNEKATKKAIVDHFKDHLGQASKEDVVLFYYSGHGTREEADRVFWQMEEDRKLESLVPYDGYTQDQNGTILNLIADKELRYLVHKIAENGPHIVTIFDCCHSGGNTRNAYIAEQANDVKERRFINRSRLSQAFPARAWKSFIFADEIPYEGTQNHSMVQLLPEGRHIQMAACQNDQSAFEVNGEGVFTKNLLEVLNRCEGEVTYYDLQSRIQNYLKNQFDQTPRVYFSGEGESGLYRGFLNRDIEGKPLYGNISFNADLGWIMDIGAMHGISPEASKIKVLSLDEEEEYRAEAGEVHTSYSEIIFDQDPDQQPDTGTSYKGFPSDYFSCSTGIYFNIEENTLGEKLLDLVTGKDSALIRVDAEYQADYCIQQKKDELYITKPGSPDVPVVAPQKIKSEGDLAVVKNYLFHLSRFEFIKNLHNPNTYLFARDPVEVRVLQQSTGKGENPVPLSNGEVNLEYERLGDDRWGGSIRIVLKNRSDRKLYCALFYLSMDFGVNTSLLKEVVTGLDPNKEVWALDGAAIGLKLDKEIVVYDYEESVSYLKLIVSTSDFKQQATRFEMPPLPKPTERAPQGTRGLDLDHYNPGNIEDWTTRLIPIRIRNPLHGDW